MPKDIDKKILTLIKSVDPYDPVEYFKEITKEYRIEKINENIINCKKCKLCNNNIKSICTDDCTKAIVLVISECVSEEEKNSNESIVGGLSENEEIVIEQICELTGVSREIFFGCKAVNCCPDYMLPALEERKICCNNYLYNIIDVINPAIIIALGPISANALNDYVEDDNSNFRIKYNVLNHRNKICNFRGYDMIITHSINRLTALEEENKDEEMINQLKDELLLDFHKALTIAKTKKPKIIKTLYNI